MAAPRGSIKLPRLRTKDELLKTSPEIFSKLLLGEDLSSARSTGGGGASGSGGSGAAAAKPGSAALRPSGSAHGSRPGSLHRAGSRGGTGLHGDTPRGFGPEPLTVDQELAIELESVKRERQQLLGSISQVKAEAGTAGGEAQQADIRQLLRELELKKAKLNELRGESMRAEAVIARTRDDDTDAQRLTPDECAQETAYIQDLRDEMARVEEDLQEAEAKNRLYSLLGERTRREHMALDQKVRDKQECHRACLDDLASLADHYNTTRAAKEGAVKDLARTKRQVEEARADWMRKIRERRAEVNELQKRQRKEHEREVRKRERQQEKEKAERAAQAKLKMEEEAYQLQVAALAPKVEAMEASWNRLRAISGAETPEQVVDYWQGLRSKEARMRELVCLAEQREAACKAEISRLLASRSAMYEGGSGAATRAASPRAASARPERAPGSRRASDQEGGGGADGEGAEGEAAAPEAGEQHQGGQQPAEEGQGVEAAAARISEADKRIEVAQAQFNKLRSICVAAEQGMGALQQRLTVALEAPAAAAAAAAAAASAAAAAAEPPPAHAAGPAGPGSRLTSAGTTNSANGGHGWGAADGMRRSAAGGSRQGRTSREHVAVGAGGSGAAPDALGQAAALSSKAQRLNSSRAHAAADAAGSSSGLALVPEDATSGGRRRGTREAAVASLPLSGLPGSGGSVSGGRARAVLPSRGRNTIEDESFFEALPQLLADVTDKLERLLASGEGGLDPRAIAAAAAAAGLGSGAGSASTSAASTARRGTGGGSATSTPRGATVQAVTGGLLPAAGDATAPAAHGAHASGADEAAAEVDGGSSRRQTGESQAGAAAAAAEGEAAAPGADATGAPQEEQPAAVDAAGSSSSAPAATVAPAGEAPTSTSGGTTAAPGEAPPPQQPAASSAGRSPALSAAGRSSLAQPLAESERALLKGMHRRTWVGAPWLDAGADAPTEVALAPSMKRRKGKKKDATAGPDLSRILGYTPPTDVPAESDSEPDPPGAAAEAGFGPGADGVPDREWIKLRAAKVAARQSAKAAAAAQASAR